MNEPQPTPTFDNWYVVAHPQLVRSVGARCGGDLALAAEVVDEAMVRALERWGRVGSMASPEAWTYRVATNLLRRHFRRRGGERRALARTPPSPEWMSIVEPSPIWTAVRELSGREQEAIVLRYVMGFTEAEIAVALDMSEGSASSLLSRSRKRLRAQVEPSGDLR